MSEEISTADANLAEIARLRAENAELRAELLRRAEMDAEDMHRIQVRYDHLYRQFESLQTRISRGMTTQPPPTIYVDSDVPALLAELEAARAYITYTRRAHSDMEQELLLLAYDEATKARPQ